MVNHHATGGEFGSNVKSYLKKMRENNKAAHLTASQSEEEIPVHTIFGHVLLIRGCLHAYRSQRSQNQQRCHCAAQSRTNATLKTAGFSGDKAKRERERADPKVHEAGAEGLRLGEAPREGGEVHSEDAE